MSGLFGRVFQYLVNEVAVKSLANSQLFQRFAMRTHLGVEKSKKLVNKQAENLGDNMSDFKGNASAFGRALKQEIEKDLNRLNKK